MSPLAYLFSSPVQNDPVVLFIVLTVLGLTCRRGVSMKYLVHILSILALSLTATSPQLLLKALKLKL